MYSLGPPVTFFQSLVLNVDPLHVFEQYFVGVAGRVNVGSLEVHVVDVSSTAEGFVDAEVVAEVVVTLHA